MIVLTFRKHEPVPFHLTLDEDLVRVVFEGIIDDHIGVLDVGHGVREFVIAIVFGTPNGQFHLAGGQLCSCGGRSVVDDACRQNKAVDLAGSVNGHCAERGVNDILQVGLCFTAVDDGEWMVIPANAKSGEREIMANTLTPGGKTPATAELNGRICGTLSYDVTALDLDHYAPLIITVRSLFANPREGSPCKHILHRFETNAAAQALGVTLTCSDDISSETIRGPKDYVLSIQSYDSTKWTQEEAMQKIEKLLDSQISGPWVFEIR